MEWVVAVAVVVAFGYLALSDVRTMKVPIRRSIQTTTLALGGLGVVGVTDQNWSALGSAVVGAVGITVIQLVPVIVQRRRGTPMIGRADVRLGIPFGFTLGYFGLVALFWGFLLANLAGLGWSLATGRNRIPFVAFMAAGMGAGLLIAAISAS